MKIDRDGVPFIAAALVPAAGFAIARRPGWATTFAALGGFLAFFFRDPDRLVPTAPGLVVSPADGRVMIAGPSDKRWAPAHRSQDEGGPAHHSQGEGGPPGEWKQVTIFLSPLDVHINRSPVEGRIVRIEYRPGRFLPAFDERSNDNELNELWIDHSGQTIVVRQVVGILARRIVCRVREAQCVERGQRIGLMKFGSRMDVFLPVTAELRVRVGERVVAGETILAILDESRAG